MSKSNTKNDTGDFEGVTAMVLLTHGGLAAHLSTGEIVQNPDPVALADMLLAVGLTAQSVRMPDWRVGDRAPLAGQKIALMQRMHRAR
jgi:hypothetical protein